MVLELENFNWQWHMHEVEIGPKLKSGVCELWVIKTLVAASFVLFVIEGGTAVGQLFALLVLDRWG